MKKNEARKFKIETAEVGSMRLVAARPAPNLRDRQPSNAREVILKLIQAIRNL